LRGKTQPPSFGVAAGVKEGVAFNDLPVVIADPADNAGGGAPSDNTDIVRHLIDSKVENACIGPIWDPIAVRICFDAGLGAKIGVVKPTNHFMAAYGPIAKKVIYVESSGPLRRDHRKVPYTKVQRPIWPLDENAKPLGLIF